MPSLVFSLLLGLFPVLRLYAANADRMAARYVLVPAGLCLLGTFVVWEIFRRLGRDAARAGFATAFALFLFFSYGKVRSTLGVRVSTLGDHRLLLPLYLVLMAGGVALILRSRRDLRPFVGAANVFALALSAITLLPVFAKVAHRAAPSTVVRLVPPAQAPDVYYIILDAYGRESVLREFYGFDNGPFLKALESRGFVVPRRSRSNYLYTTMSLSSSLNMDYLDALRPKGYADDSAWLTTTQPLLDLIETNRVARSFKAAGYRYVVLPSGLSFTNRSRIADVNFGSAYDLREFNSLFGQTTMLAPAFGDQIEQVTAAGLENLEAKLLECPAMPGPKFVFAHFLSPHPPYQFRADGSPAPPAAPGVRLAWGDHAAYVAQIEYLNRFVLRAVDRILRDSKRPPIIVVQGDHGPALRDETDAQSSMEPWGPALWNARSGNLSAYLVPKAMRGTIPDDVTPVNAFRLIFRGAFGAQIPLRENRTYYSNLGSLFRFIPVPRKALE